MDQRISVITLGVRDIARTRRFYEDGLGWTAGRVYDDIVFYQLNGVIIGCYEWELLLADAGISGAAAEQVRPGAIALACNVRTREEVDAVIAQAVRAGGAVARAACEMEWGGYSGYFADPDGHRWEVAWNPGFPIAEDGSIRLGDG